MTTAASPGIAAAAMTAFSPSEPLSAASLCSIQRLAGNRAAAGVVARHGTVRHSGRTLQRASGLLPPAKVAEVYGYWLISIAKARGVNVGDAAVDQAARDKTKAQVGDANFAGWERWERGADAAAAAKGEEAHAAEVAAAEPPDVLAGLRARHDAMWKETAKMRAEVVQTEYLCGKLNFGSGAKGTTARITAGAYTATWGIGARTVNSVAEHVPMLVLTTVGTVFGSEMAERGLVKQGQAVKREGGEMGEDAATATRLVSGATQERYAATRGPYARWQASFGAFSEASSQFARDLQLDGINGLAAQGKDIAAMEAAEKQMREASNDYQMACAQLGVQSEAKSLDTAAGHIVEGSQGLVATAATMVLPEVAPSLAEVRSAVKGAEGLTARQLEKEGAEAVAATVAKQGEKEATMSVGTELAQKSGMPVENQQAIADVCKQHDVVIDVRPTNVDAPARLAEGHLPKPEAIKAKTINELDTYIGFSKDSKGLVGFKEPTPPVRSEVPPELWDRVNARYAERASEFKDLAPDMKNLALPPGARDKFAAVGFDRQVVVDSGGVVRVVEGEGKAGVGFTGDHDLFQITNRDGTPVSPDKYNQVVTDLVQKRVGVEHGAHMHWDVPAKPASPAFKDPTKGFQGIAEKHMPSPTGGEDLYRFNPDGSVTQVRANPSTDNLAAARAAGKADKGAAVGDIDRTVGAIGK